MRLIDADAFFDNFPELAIEPYINAPTVTPDKIQAIMSDYLVYRCESQRLQGEWEEPFEHNGKMYHKCNQCHISSPFMLIDNYCSYCGAKMKKEGKEE